MPIPNTLGSGPSRLTRDTVKRAVNPGLSANILEVAKALKINGFQVCERHLGEVARCEQERRWRENHADFNAAYKATVENEGLPLDVWRTF